MMRPSVVSRLWIFRQNRIRTALVAGLAIAASALAAAAPAWAQLPLPELTTIYPPGGQQGTTVEVTVGGANLETLTALNFSHPGLTAEPKMGEPDEFLKQAKPIPNQFTVKVAADVPPGIYEARVQGRYGTSNPRAFVVGSRPEVNEEGTHNQPQSAMEIGVDVTVNARSDANNIDYYKVALTRGQRVLLSVWGERIDSRIDASLVVLDEGGAEVARNMDYDGRDPFIDFEAPADGTYVIGAFDFIYGGGAEYFYRLNVHTGPHIDFVFPPAAPAGQEAKLTLYGRNLPDGQEVKEFGEAGLGLEKAEVTVTVPAEGSFAVTSFLEPQSSLIDGFDYRVGNSNAARVFIAQSDNVILEQEPNSDATTPQVVTLPCEIAGQFYPRLDRDWYQFEAKKGEVYWIEVLSHRLGLLTDPHFLVQRVVTDDKGETTVSDVAYVDDPGDRNTKIGSDFDTSTDDPSYRFTAPDDGVYRIMLDDHYGDARDDPRMVYRLVIRPEVPDYRLVAHGQQIKVANGNQVLMFSPVVRKGGTTLVQVDVDRRDGFSGDVHVSVEGLPQGVTSPGAVIGENQSTAWVVFTAAEDAPSSSTPIRIVGKATVNGQEVTREARPGCVVWGTANRTQQPPIFRLARNMHLSVCDEIEPGLVQAGDGTMLETARGASLDIPVKVTRRNDFKENLKLVATGLPNEVKPADITINGDQAEGTLKMALTNNNAKPGIYTFYLRSDTKVKYAPNPDAVTAATEEHKKLEEIGKQVAEELKQATAARDEAVKAEQAANTAMQQAQQAKDAAAKEQQAAATAADQAAKALEQAKQAAAAAADNADLAQKVTEAQKAQEEAAAKLKAADEKLAAADKALTDAQADAKAKTEAKAAAEKAVADTTEKNKRATAAVAAAKKQVDDLTKANAPKDVNFALVSTPIIVRIEATPFQLQRAAEQPVAVKQGAAAEVPLTLNKKYGFDEQVQLTLELPGGVSGISAAAVNIEKGKAEGKLEVKAAANATPGQHTVTVRAKGKFNNVNVEDAHQFVLNVEPVEEPKK